MTSEPFESHNMTEQDAQSNGVSQSGGPHLWEINFVRDLFRLTIVVVLGFVVWWMRSIVQPVLLALLLAYLVNPVIVWCERRWQWSRLRCVIVIFLVVSTAVLGLVVAVLPVGISQVRNLINRLPDYAADLGINDYEYLNRLRQHKQELLERTAQNLGSLWGGFATSLGVVTGFIGGVTSLAIGIALVPVYFFYFSVNWPTLVAWPITFVPASQVQRFRKVIRLMDHAVGSYFRMRLLIAMIMGGLYATGWGIAGVPYWLLIGVAGGLLGIIPYAAALAWLAAILLKFLDLGGAINDIDAALVVFLWPTLVYGIVQASDDWLLTPWLQGREMSMNFITIILSVLIGGAVAGFLGMLFAVPVAACLGICWTEIVRPRLVRFAKTH